MSDNVGSEHCDQNEASFQNTSLSAQRDEGTSDMVHSLEESRLNDLALVVKRPAHNAIERQRREDLNTKLQQLAHALPSLHSVRRPSKTMIVAKALEFVTMSVRQETTLQKKVESLRQENDSLRTEAERHTRTTLTTMTTRGASTQLASSSHVGSLYMYPTQFVVKSQQTNERLHHVASEVTTPLSLSPRRFSAPGNEPPIIQRSTTASASRTKAPHSPKLAETTSVHNMTTGTTATAAAAATNTRTNGRILKRRRSVGEISSRKRGWHSTYPYAATPGMSCCDTAAYASSQFTLTLDTPSQEFYHQQDLVTPLLDHHQRTNCYCQSPLARTAMMVALPPPPPPPMSASSAIGSIRLNDTPTPFSGWPADSDNAAMMSPFPPVMGAHFYEQ